DFREGCVEREVHAPLRHRGAREAFGGRIFRRSLRAKILVEWLQRIFHRLPREKLAIMVSWDCENRSGIIAIRIVELIVVITFLPEEIHYVSQVKKERRAPAAVICSGQISAQAI